MSHESMQRDKNMTQLHMDANDAHEYDPSLYTASKTCLPETAWGAIDVRMYRQQGYVALEPALTLQQVADAHDGLTDLIHGRVADFADVQFEGHSAQQIQAMTVAERELNVRRVFQFCRFEQRLESIMRDPQLIALVTQFLGDRESICFQEMALLKPPQGREKPWHQDHAYFNLAMDEPVVGVWIALDDATVENGCMHVLPGSHREGAVVHFKRRDWQICDTDILGKSITAVPLKAGGLMLFDGLIHHGTPHNPTQQRRRALQFHYCAKDAMWVNEEARLAVFGEEGKDVTC